MSDKAEKKAVDLDQIRELIDLLIEKEVAELEVEQDGVKVKIRRVNGVATSVTPAPPAANPASAPVVGPAEPEEELDSVAEAAGFGDAYVVTSPMVGTFYRASEAEADPFVDVGDEVQEGETLCIVEAMKLMNEIASEIKGEVLAIFVENAEPVEFGQQLFAIRPLA